jgi:AraC family transcriptional activator of mtrCDE
MAGELFWRISRQDLDKLMTMLDVTFVRLSECVFAAGAHLAVAGTEPSTIHYCLQGAGFILLDDETPIRLTPHTLVIVPPRRAMTIAAADRPTASRNTGKYDKGGFTQWASQQHAVENCGPTLVLACGSFRANYGPALDLFASLAKPVVERFDTHERLDQVMAYAMAELAAQDIGGGPMSAALLKLVLLALLRRCLVSTNTWIESFSTLSDPPIARAFAEMTSRPSAAHTVRTLSHTVGLSRSAFMARFSAAFGESPMSLLRRVRMRHAADLLAANAPSIDRVALNAGYQSRSSFTRTFRRYYGSDPSEYRAKARDAVVTDVVPTEETIAQT